MARYTKDDLIKIVFENQARMIDALNSVSSAINSFNDSNLLHKRAIEVNTTATKEMTKTFQGQFSLIKWIVAALIIAIIAIAIGKEAKEIIKFIPFIK